MPLLHRCAVRIAPPARTFLPHTQRRIHLGVVGDAVILAANSISAVHEAGVPWYLAIPAAALGVNLTVRLPVQFYTRRLVARRTELGPLVSAWSARHAASVPREGGPAKERLWRLRVAGLTEKSRRRIYKAWGVQRWKTLAPLLSMVPFVVVSEALRRLCGAPAGWISQQVGLVSADPAAAAAALADTTVTTMTGLFRADLAEGGCLWFVDLTAMDPYYLLPLACSALLARSSWGRLSSHQLRALLSLDGSSDRAARPPIARIQTGIGRALLFMPLFPLLFADLPSAIFLYWASTFALNDVNESILQRMVPMPVPALKMVRRVPPALPYLRGEDKSG